MNGKLDSFILGILFTVSLQLYMRNKSYFNLIICILLILPVTEEQFIEVNKNIKEIVNTDTAIINCGAYGKGRIYHLEYTKLADSERGRL